MKYLKFDELDSMWSSNVKRKTTLLVGDISLQDEVFTFCNQHWFFNVPYTFRSALDIKREQRKKNKKPYMVWTQGPLISFKEGDVLRTPYGGTAVQVRFAQRMGWDPTISAMYPGSVVYTEFSVKGHIYTKRAETTCSQMDFLQLLITGKAPP